MNNAALREASPRAGMILQAEAMREGIFSSKFSWSEYVQHGSLKPNMNIYVVVRRDDGEECCVVVIQYRTRTRRRYGETTLYEAGSDYSCLELAYRSNLD